MNVAPKTPNSILEFQGGAFDPWGGPGYEACAVLLNHEFERVFYKNKMSFSTTIFNIYMACPPISSCWKKARTNPEICRLSEAPIGEASHILECTPAMTMGVLFLRRDELTGRNTVN